MRNRLKRCVLPLLTATGIFPVIALVSFGHPLPLLLLWTAAYLMTGCLCAQLSGRWRVCTAAGCALGMALLGLAGVLRTGEPLLLLMGIVHGALLLLTLPDRENVRQTVVYAGFVLHAAAHIFLNLMGKTALRAAYAPAQPLLTADLVVFLVIALLTLNHISLSSALPEARAVPGSIRRRNKLVTLMMLAGALLIALIPALGRWLAAGWEMLRRAVGKLIQWLMSLAPAQTAPAASDGEAMAGFAGMGEEAAAGPFALWMEKILLWMAGAVTAVLLVLALRFLWKKLKKLLQWLFFRLQSYAASAAEDYEDEMQNTRTQGEEHYALNRRRRKIRSGRELDSLPPRERIRRRYALLKAKHPEWPAGQTARETLPEEAARIYERARYSTHPVTEEDARRFSP